MVDYGMTVASAPQPQWAMAPFRSLFEVVEQRAQEAGDAVAAMDLISLQAPRQLPTQITYGELREAASKLAALCMLQFL